MNKKLTALLASEMNGLGDYDPSAYQSNTYAPSQAPYLDDFTLGQGETEAAAITAEAENAKRNKLMLSVALGLGLFLMFSRK